MKAIHLIQKDPALKPWPKEKGSQTYESGYWNIAPEKAEQAVGAHIYFHSQKVEPSFFGGTITEFRIKPDDPWKDRIIFTLEASRDFKGVRTETSGWSMEKKFVE